MLRPRASLAEGLSKLERQAISNAHDFLNENPVADLSVQDLATQVGLSAGKLNRGFQSQFGVTAHEFMLAERMRKAEGYLNHTDMEVGEIAQQLGYGSASSFIRAFKAQHGVTPRKFRCL